MKRKFKKPKTKVKTLALLGVSDRRSRFISSLWSDHKTIETRQVLSVCYPKVYKYDSLHIAHCVEVILRNLSLFLNKCTYMGKYNE